MLHVGRPIGRRRQPGDAARQLVRRRCRGCAGDRHRRRRGEAPAPRAAGEVGIEQPFVDRQLLAVGPGGDRLAPALARHGGQGRWREPWRFPACCGRWPADDPLRRCAAAAAEGDNVRWPSWCGEPNRRCGSCAQSSGPPGRSRTSSRRPTCGRCARCHGSAARRRCACGCCRSPGTPAPTTSAAGSASAVCSTV